MKERIKMICCIGLIIISLPIVITMIFQGDEFWPDAKERNRVEENSQQEEDLLAVFVGILAKQMPVSYEKEALKAQAVIVRTNYRYALAVGEEPEEGLSAAEQIKLFGKEEYAKYYSRLEECFTETGDEVLTYQGNLMKAPFFAVSAGQTRQGSPPFASVESKQDITSEDFLKVSFLSYEELSAQCNEAWPDAALSADEVMEQIEITEKEESGYVKSIRLGAVTVSGEEFRNVLGLNSACFSIRQVDHQIRIVTKGLGHGFGLSIYGANELAKEGADYREILNYYYSNIEITESE